MNQGASARLGKTDLMESWPTFRKLGRGRRRDELVIAACTYICDPEKIVGIVTDQLAKDMRFAL